LDEAFEALYRHLEHQCAGGEEIKVSTKLVTMPFFNMSVASDPTSSWQVRTEGKTLKA